MNNIAELKRKHFAIPDEAFCSSELHTKVSIQFAIDVLKEVGSNMDVMDADVKYLTVFIRNTSFMYDKIKELKEYLNEK